MADLATELAKLNAQAAELLAKYDGAFEKLDEETQNKIIEIQDKAAELQARIEALGFKFDENGILVKEDGSEISVGNALKLGGKSLEEILNSINIHKTIITNGTTLDDLSALGIDISQIEDTFYTDDTLGIGWGTNDDTWRAIEISVPNGSTSFTITYSGYYNNPSGGLGHLAIVDENDNSLLVFSDVWTNDSEGQSLYINEETIFEKSEINIKNRTDIVQLNGATKIYIKMKGYTSSYPYTKRYIKKLVFN